MFNRKVEWTYSNQAVTSTRMKENNPTSKTGKLRLMATKTLRYQKMKSRTYSTLWVTNYYVYVFQAVE